MTTTNLNAPPATQGSAAPLSQTGLNDTVPASSATTVTIPLEGAVTGVINTAGDHDWYAVQLVAGQSYRFTMNSTAAGLDPYIRLRNANGALLKENDDFELGTLNARVVFTATTSGTYFVDAGALNDNSTGSYALSAFTVPTPPVYTNDQVATYLTTGYWGTPPTHWEAGSIVTYNVQGLLPAAQALARAAFATWQDVANLTFQETTGQAEIALDDTSSGAFANFNGFNGVTSSATVNVQPNWSGEANPGLDSYTFQTFIHEIGHTLGLGHGGPYNGDATYGTDNLYQNDTWATTIMSYFGQDNYNGASRRFVLSPMMADIIAVQTLYGANTTTRTGDTVYGHNSNAGAIYNFSTFTTAPSFTIWDAAGLDTLDASGYAAAQTINLAAETSSSIGGLLQNIHIARGAVIENARGGSGADTINGNTAANTLTGNSGNDSLDGGLGADTLIGGAGVDSLQGGEGDDFVYFDQNDAFANVQGGAGTDVLYIDSSIGAPWGPFNLAAQGFERAQVDTVDTAAVNAYNWSLFTTFFGPGWVRQTEVGTFDNGDGWNAAYSAAGTLATYIYYDLGTNDQAYQYYTNSFNAAVQQISTVGLRDDLSVFTTTYDVGPTAAGVEAWSSITTNFNAANAPLYTNTNYDNGDTAITNYVNGILNSYTFYDRVQGVGGNHDYQFYTINYNAAGVGVSVNGTYDNGSTWFNLL